MSTTERVFKNRVSNKLDLQICKLSLTKQTQTKQILCKIIWICSQHYLRSQWDNGQARHSLNLSLPFVVAYCLTEISAFSQAMWTKPNMDTQRKNTWETMSCLRFECSLWMPSGKRAYCRVGRGGLVALTLICWGFL